MTTQEKIADLTKKKFNDYKGRQMQKIGAAHALLRMEKGDEWFLQFLESRPDMPKYIPPHQIKPE